jgi:cytochrome c2
MKRFAVIVAIVALAACHRQEKTTMLVKTGSGDAQRGKQAINKYGCTACHDIPGVSGPQGSVGPPLTKMGSRSYIAGKFQNTPETMIQWLQNPQGMDPQNAMPNLGVTPADARDITAYLESLQ